MEVLEVVSNALIAHGTAITMVIGSGLALVAVYLKKRKKK
jgi:hypothetical protein